jgi:hypothetical protein
LLGGCGVVLGPWTNWLLALELALLGATIVNRARGALREVGGRSGH